jgi:hypothetical protein
MAKSVKPKDVRLIKLKLNDRLTRYIEAIATARLSRDERRDKRGYRSPAVVAAILDWHDDRGHGRTLAAEKVRLYMLEYLDAAFVENSPQRDVYLPAEAHAALVELAKHLREDYGLSLAKRGKGEAQLVPVATVAVCRLADLLGAHEPLVPGDC